MDLLKFCQSFLDDLLAVGVTETDAAEALLSVALLAKVRATSPSGTKRMIDESKTELLSRVAIGAPERYAAALATITRKIFPASTAH